MFDTKQIDQAAQKQWSQAIEDGMAMSASSVNYTGATELALEEGMATLCPIPNPTPGMASSFARWNISLTYKDESAHKFAETDRATFKGVYVLAEDCEGELREFTMRGRNGNDYTVKGYALKEGARAKRRFPSLFHTAEGSVPYVAEKQVIKLQTIDARLVGYDKDNKRFAHIDAKLCIEK